MENIVYNELKVRSFSVDVGVVGKREPSLDDKSIHNSYEIDFVANKGYKRYYIQVAYLIKNEEKM